MNKNIVRKTSETSENAGLDELNYLREVVRNTAEWYTERMIDYIRHNTSLFPEYSSNTNEDLTPTTQNYYSGMNLDPVAPDYKITLNDFLTPDLRMY